ncbi:hypothetical protein BO70DRAFT_165357 [Aspergillus heteromorphus CBS 117.55]|uniref:Uncharacterized protein n=1 Tax=Aspergillus heteromorphus CBS 117.55 TaxID=1448321 RepID=A0A317WS77_9EURO|nr:uncharacterized protein BO70DRAFT_165357 [Aspergillus heteromorphus CBS 117.55]PWY89306.1 hypothetical protein BO70DRAFT_165357 [Aspergillus heteromorphus CBS 117.55]
MDQNPSDCRARGKDNADACNLIDPETKKKPAKGLTGIHLVLLRAWAWACPGCQINGEKNTIPTFHVSDKIRTRTLTPREKGDHWVSARPGKDRPDTNRKIGPARDPIRHSTYLLPPTYLNLGDRAMASGKPVLSYRRVFFSWFFVDGILQQDAYIIRSKGWDNVQGTAVEPKPRYMHNATNIVDSVPTYCRHMHQSCRYQIYADTQNIDTDTE